MPIKTIYNTSNESTDLYPEMVRKIAKLKTGQVCISLSPVLRTTDDINVISDSNFMIYQYEGFHYVICDDIEHYNLLRLLHSELLPHTNDKIYKTIYQ